VGDHRRRTPDLFCGALLPADSCQNAEQITAKTPNDLPPKRRTIFCQNAERFSAKTPNDFPPKRRMIFCQNAEQISAKTPKNIAKTPNKGYYVIIRTISERWFV
jgi:hypothetical protein